MSKPEDIRKKLLAKKGRNLHARFFKENPEIQYFQIFITNHDDQQLVPFRNKKCSMVNCVYDLEEIVSKYQIGKDNIEYSFLCDTCNNLISISGFQYDETLALKIRDIWNQNNSSGITVRVIRQLRNGKVEVDPEMKGNSIYISWKTI